MKKIINFWTACGTASAFIAAAFSASPAFAIVGQPIPGAIDLQEAASPVKEDMHWFHNTLMMPILTSICVFVLGLLIYVVIRFNAKANPVPSKTTHNTALEVIWTLIPVLILVVISIPSMKLLYFLDRTTEAEMTIKAVGHQWYWTYEYPDHGGINVTSNMITDKDIDISKGQVRLLSTDGPLVLPVDTNIRILITASDVIHSWAVPAFGVKLDAIPGRLNETWTRIEKIGTFYGQCSQLCGANHAYMPIEVKAVSKEDFAKWIHANKGKMPEEIAAEAAAAKEAEAAKAAKEEKNKKAGVNK